MKYIPEVSQKLRALASNGSFEASQSRSPSAVPMTLQLLESKAIEITLLNTLVKISCMNMQDRHYEVYTEETAKDNIIHRHSYVLLASRLSAEDDDTAPSDHVLGFLAFRPILENSKRQLYIWELQIDARYQRKGLGQMLVWSLINLGKNVMSPKKFSLCLTCSKRNEAGYIAYTKMGFVPNGDSDDEDPFWILELQVE
ncbi:Hypothetical protein GLP15_4401 [Giardia lamblia P15]|uniref:N-alpha-acetyltransferase 40 n=1 Tax=Giardia intestinalis (strain P15) TaxID=658858 RepID=E1F358_GIAIA|nr:Hypothetical protein GLP15_4401 [Giardia lamblia P15]